MYLPCSIALRYLFNNKKKNLTAVIAIFSILSVAVATTALLCSLSVFHGLENLTHQLFKSLDPAIKIQCREGKNFSRKHLPLKKIQTIQGVGNTVAVLEANALIQYQGRQAFATLKGVSNDFLQTNYLSPFIVKGKIKLYDKKKKAQAILGKSLQVQLSIPCHDPFSYLEVIYPQKKISHFFSFFPTYRQNNIYTSAIFSITQAIDSQYMIVPIDFLACLTCNEDTITSLDIYISKGYDERIIKKKIGKILPLQLQALTYLEQHASLSKAIHTEKIILWIAFFLIYGVAYLQIFFTLYMLVIHKKKDMTVLFALGIRQCMIRKIFLCYGFFLALIGTLAGIFGALLCIFLQDRFGLVTVGLQTTIVQAYPVKMIPKDMLYIVCSMFFFTFLIVYFPSQRAVRSIHKKYL